MRYAQIDSANTVVNVIEADPAFRLDGYTLVQSSVANIGDAYNGSGFTPATPGPVPIPATVPMVSLRLVLLSAGILATIDTGISGLSDTLDNNRLKERWFRGTQADRANPALDALGASFGLTTSQIDDFFREAAAIS